MSNVKKKSMNVHVHAFNIGWLLYTYFKLTTVGMLFLCSSVVAISESTFLVLSKAWCAIAAITKHKR